MTKKAKERTLWETQGRRFVRDLDYGKEGEERIARHLRKYKSVVDVRDISNTRRGIDDDIDFEIVYADGHVSTAEIKTDTMAHRTGNLAYEKFSHRNPGCFARTKADHIIYLLDHTGEAFVLDPKKFRAFIAEMEADQDKAKSLRVAWRKMGEGASGYLVPIKSILKTDVVEAKMMVAA